MADKDGEAELEEQPQRSEAELALRAARKESKLLRSWLLAAGMTDDAVRDLASERLEGLVRQHFDAQVLDETPEEPAWLESLLKEKRWRALLCELLAQHPSCVLLQFAVRTLAEGEHASEVAGFGGLQSALGAQSSLPRFILALAKQLSAVLNGARGAESALSNVACSGEVQLLCSQLLLHALSAQRGGESARLLQRVAAEMSTAAEVSLGKSSHRLHLLSAGLSRHSTLMNCFLAILSSGARRAPRCSRAHTHARSRAS